MPRKKKRDKDDTKPRVHNELDGFDIKVNKFGEVISNIDISKINSFLDDNVEDKKLNERDGKFGRSEKDESSDDEK